MKRYLLTLTLISTASAGWAQTYLSPNQLGGSGQLPGNHAHLIFSLSNGNWVPQVMLPPPAQVLDKARIEIRSNAAYLTQILQAHSDVPIPSLPLADGQSLAYVFSSAKRRWEVEAPTVYGQNTGAPLNMATTSHRVVRAVFANGAWSPSLNLPQSAMDEAIVLASSRAAWSSRIDPSQVLHASTMPLRTRDEYAFSFNARLGKWILRQGPETRLSLASLPQGQMPAPATALTRLNLPVGTAAKEVRLPAAAGDRDRVIITSHAQARTHLLHPSLEEQGTFTVGDGQTYEFMWNAQTRAWIPLQMPRTRVLVKTLNGPTMAPIRTPITELVASDGNWARLVVLPNQAKPGDRVWVKSAATWAFAVGWGDTAGPNRHTVTQGEEVSFVRLANTWARETDTIRILLAYGQGVTAQFGASAARARQLESLRLTNESLANSGARFRFQVASLLEVPNLGGELRDALGAMRSHPGIQAERERVMADAVYYEGIEAGCGWAFVNPSPSFFNMAATGSTACGTTVMRHELGHNLGLDHGNGIVPTVMSGNAVPFFATPMRIEPTLRVPMSQDARVPDEVSIMDKNAPAIARFR